MIRKSLSVIWLIQVVLGLSTHHLSAQEIKPSINPDASQNASGSRNQLHFQLMQAMDQIESYRPFEQVKGNLTLSGSVTMLDLGRRWSQTFKLFHPEVDIQGGAEGSEAALKALSENANLVIGISRPVDESDLKLLQSGQCKEPVAVTIGMEALAIYTHKSNPIQSVSLDAFRTVFAEAPDGDAKPKVWGDLGVTGSIASESIARYERGTDSGTQTFLTRVLLAGAKTAKPKKICASNSEVCESISGDPLGVGIADANATGPNLRRLPLLVDNQFVDATEENVLTGKYPLVRPLILIFDKSKAGADGRLRESMIRFVLSREGQMSVMKSGFYPVDPGFAHHQISEVFGQQVR